MEIIKDGAFLLSMVLKQSRVLKHGSACHSVCGCDVQHIHLLCFGLFISAVRGNILMGITF